MLASTLSRLGVVPIATRGFILADGRRIEGGLRQIRMQLEGEEFIVTVIFGDEGTQPLLGATDLEAFDLACPTQATNALFGWMPCSCERLIENTDGSRNRIGFTPSLPLQADSPCYGRE